MQLPLIFTLSPDSVLRFACSLLSPGARCWTLNARLCIAQNLFDVSDSWTWSSFELRLMDLGILNMQLVSFSSFNVSVNDFQGSQKELYILTIPRSI
jgi:hypothetical protein